MGLVRTMEDKHYKEGLELLIDSECQSDEDAMEDDT